VLHAGMPAPSTRATAGLYLRVAHDPHPGSCDGTPADPTPRKPVVYGRRIARRPCCLEEHRSPSTACRAGNPRDGSWGAFACGWPLLLLSGVWITTKAQATGPTAGVIEAASDGTSRRGRFVVTGPGRLECLVRPRFLALRYRVES